MDIETRILPFWEERDSHNRKDDIIWGRDRIFDNVSVSGLINVFGHTPMRFVEKRNNQVCIDLGCFFSSKLVAYDFLTGHVEIVDDLICSEFVKENDNVSQK